MATLYTGSMATRSLNRENPCDLENEADRVPNGHGARRLLSFDACQLAPVTPTNGNWEVTRRLQPSMSPSRTLRTSPDERDHPDHSLHRVDARSSASPFQSALASMRS